METWQYILGAAVLLVAFVAWRMFIKPTLEFYTTAKQLVPLLQEINKVLCKNPLALTELTIAVKKAEINSEHLKIGVAAQKELGEDDRRKLGDLMENVDGMKKDARAVADDLRESHRRADEVSNQPHGAAADAAAQLTDKEKRTDGGGIES